MTPQVLVAFPPESDSAEIPTTWSETAHSFQNGATNELRPIGITRKLAWPYRPDEANGLKSGLVVSNKLRQLEAGGSNLVDHNALIL